jgi:copper chaperone CopZ
MRCQPPRIIYLAHDSPGRVRFRLSWLRDHRDEATSLADALSELAGVDEVQVRPFTGSLLVTYDPTRTDVATIRAALCSFTGVDAVTLPGHETPAQIRQILRGSFDEGSELSQAAVKAFQGINVDVLRMTHGRVSLGAMTSLSMWVGAAAKVLASGRIELPEWHQMLWWGFRSFSELEGDAIETGHKRTLEELCVPATDEDTAAPDPAELQRHK